MNADFDFDIDVLVVGGGIVGLSAAAFLRAHGVPCALVERRSGTSPHPRARGINPRAVEALTQLGLGAEVSAAADGFADQTLRARVHSLTGPELMRADLPVADLAWLTPSRWALCGQDRLEPAIRGWAERAGADIRFGARLVDFTETPDHVLARVERNGSDFEIRARYLVAADGAHSGVRDRLGIPADGRRGLRHQVSIVFEADLSGPLGDRRFAICQVVNDDVDCLLVHDDTLRQGTIYVQYDPAAGESAESFTTARCVALVRAAIGVPGLPVSITAVQSWELSARNARRYRQGRVFLAGDSAHVMPPVGGFGASTGVQDAHNLAWKLNMVLAGAAGPDLLDTYDAERRPVGEITVAQCARRVNSRTGFAPPRPGDGMIDDLAMTFGHRYASAAVSGGVPEVVTVDRLAAQPGTRAPHLVLRDGDRHLSVLDLFGLGFTLLTGPDGADWADAVAGLDVRVRAYRITEDGTVPHPADSRTPVLVAEAGAWASRYGTGPGEAVLVRPDGIVAWRSCDPAGLPAALAGLLARVPASGAGAR
jgi:putative polyketide hydroxylase